MTGAGVGPAGAGEETGVGAGSGAVGAGDGLGAGAGAVVEVGLDPSPGSLPPPSPLSPPEDPGTLTGDGGATAPAGGAVPWSPPAEEPLDPWAGDPVAGVEACGECKEAAGTKAAEPWSRVTFSAPATDSLRVGSSGSGAGSSSGKPGWAKSATRASPAAAVSPRRAKAVLRIRSVKPAPAKLGSRTEERSLLWSIQCTSS